MRGHGHWLLAYDVSSDRRRTKLHRFLCEFAMPLQYSVFIAQLDRRGVDTVVRGVAERVHAREDDFRMYPLVATPTTLGTSRMPRGILWLPGLVSLDDDASIFTSLRPKG